MKNIDFKEIFQLAIPFGIIGAALLVTSITSPESATQSESANSEFTFWNVIAFILAFFSGFISVAFFGIIFFLISKFARWWIKNNFDRYSISDDNDPILNPRGNTKNDND